MNSNEILNYLATNTGVLSFQDILLNFAISGVLAFVIFISYRLSHSGVTYSVRFNVSLVMLTLVTTLVMNVIGNNISLSLGMVGALSIVRFRTAIKDPRDTTYIFWCIAVGICCGVSEYMIAAIGCTVIFGFMLVFGFVTKNERYLLIISVPNENSKTVERIIDELFSGKATLKVHNSNTEIVEFIYETSEEILKKAKKSGDFNHRFYDEAKAISVNLINQSDEINR